MSSLSKEIENAIRAELAQMGDNSLRDTVTNDVSYFATALEAELREHIASADMPEGVKNLLQNSISVTILGVDHAVVSICAMRPSIYALGGSSKFGDCDLALVYNQRKRIKPTAKFYDKESKYFLPIGKIEGFARAYGNNYLENTVTSFMAKHPECTVTLSSKY